MILPLGLTNTIAATLPLVEVTTLTVLIGFTFATSFIQAIMISIGFLDDILILFIT